MNPDPQELANAIERLRVDILDKRETLSPGRALDVKLVLAALTKAQEQFEKTQRELDGLRNHRGSQILSLEQERDQLKAQLNECNGKIKQLQGSP